MSIPISLSELTGNEGFLLAESIYDEGGAILLAQGKLLDSAKVQLLKKYFTKRNFLTEDIMIPVNSIMTQNIDQDISGSIHPELKNNTLHALMKTYIAPEKNLADNLTVVGKCVAGISRSIQTDSDFSYSLGQYKNSSFTPSVFDHSLRVAQFAITLANIYNNHISQQGKIPLESIGMAALLHDFGIRYQNRDEMRKLSSKQLSEHFFDFYPDIDPEVLQKPYKEKYKNVYAYTALDKLIDNSTRTMILLSNESENEKANISPKVHKTDATTMGAKIIHLCNLYDSLLFNTIQEDISLENVSSLVGQLIQNGVVNPELGNLLLNEMPLYSNGVRVLLSTGEYAMVIKNFKGHDTANPIVKTITNPSKVIDLRDTTNITISKIVSASEKISDKVNQIEKNQIKNSNITPMQTEPFEQEISEQEKVSRRR